MTTKTRKDTQKMEKAKVEGVVGDEVTAFDAFLDHQRKAISETGKALEALIPVAVKEHGQSAFKEVVEGYRTLFNSAIDEIVDTFERAKMGVEKSRETVNDTLSNVEDVSK